MSTDATRASILHPLAPEHVPGYLAAADGSDPLFSFVVVFTLLLVVGIGGLYLTLHALPEQLAHGVGSAQLQVVGILALLALFTHNNIFWVAALLLAAFNFPDYLSPIRSIARSLAKIAGSEAELQETSSRHREDDDHAAKPEGA